MVHNESLEPYRTDFYTDFLRPTLFRLDPEAAHDLVYAWAPRLQLFAPQLKQLFHFDDPVLSTEFANHTFDNPIGLAAGFDKNARLDLLLDALGLGFAEIGSITLQPSRGNTKPRLFRLPEDRAVINRLGLNGDGAKTVAARIAALRCQTPLSVNIAKTNDATVIGDVAVKDLVGSFCAVKDLPLSYLTVNASCPNTHDGIVSEMGELELAVSEMQSLNARQLPLFIKLSPDSSDSLLSSILELGRTNKVAGYICGNTTVSREKLRTPQSDVDKIGKGGLSGAPLKALSYSLCGRVMKLKEGNQSVVACGGIASGADVFQFLQLGVSAVQVYTALIYRGPFLIKSMKQELVHILKANGTSVSDVVRSAQARPIGL